MTCRATCLGTRCPTRCVTTLVAHHFTRVARVAGLVRRYRSVSVGALKPSMGRDCHTFNIGRRNRVHFKLSTVGKVKAPTTSTVITRHLGGNPCGGVFSFTRHISFSGIGHGTFRDLTLDNNFSDFNVHHRRCFNGGDGNSAFLSALMECNRLCRRRRHRTTASLFKNMRTIRVTAPPIPRTRS